MKNLLTRNEFATRNGICARTVSNEIARGNLAAVKLGWRVLIPVAAERDWLAALPPAKRNKGEAASRDA